MVVPEAIVDAAQDGDVATVRHWFNEMDEEHDGHVTKLNFMKFKVCKNPRLSHADAGLNFT